MYETRVRVSTSQVGGDNRAHPYSVILMLQDCSLFWLEEQKVFKQYLVDNNIAMVLAYRQTDVKRYPRFGENVRVQTSIYGAKKSLGYRNTVMYDEAGEMIVSSWSIGAFIDKATGAMVNIPAEIFDTLLIEPKVEMEYAGKKIKLLEDLMEERAPIIAGKADIDFYQHVNNAEYVRMAYNLIPDDFEVKRMRFDYRSQARLGDVLIPRVALDGDVCQVVLDSQDEQMAPYCVFEFSR